VVLHFFRGNRKLSCSFLRFRIRFRKKIKLAFSYLENGYENASSGSVFFKTLTQAELDVSENSKLDVISPVESEIEQINGRVRKLEAELENLFTVGTYSVNFLLFLRQKWRKFAQKSWVDDCIT